MKTTGFYKLFLLLVCLALLGSSLTGCAGGEKEIKIGAPMPLTGPYASDGEQMQKALELAFEEQNAKGGGSAAR